MLAHSHKEINGGELLFELLKYTLETNERRLQECSFLTAQQQRKEYRTIKINLGRQVGHTTAAKKIFSEYKNVLLIANNAGATAIIRESLGVRGVGKTPSEKEYINTHVLSEDNVIKTGSAFWRTISTYGTKNMPDVVILDTASYSQVSESTLWEIFPDAQFLILLG